MSAKWWPFLPVQGEMRKWNLTSSCAMMLCFEFFQCIIWSIRVRHIPPKEPVLQASIEKVTARPLEQKLMMCLQCLLQTCQPLRILRNHYAFRVSNTPLRKPVQNVGKLRILRNFGAIRPIPRNLQQLSRLAVSRKSPAGQNIDKDLFILRLPSASASDFATRSTKEASWRGETMPNET